MRLIKTLFLGASVLACASIPLRAQNTPAVPATNGAPATAFAAAPAATAAAAAPAPAAAAPTVDSNGIVATVNELSISDYELDQRVAFTIAVSGFKPTDDDIKRMRAEMLSRLEEEKIQLLEAKRQKVTVSPVEVNKRIDAFLADNNSTMEQLVKVLNEAGSSIETLRNQYIAAIAWQQVVQREFQSDIVITPAMIDDGLRRAMEGANRSHYRVSEIFLPVDRPEDEAKVKALIEDIEKRLRTGAAFRNMARQFSRNPSAAAGGDIGWVYDGQLDPELNNVVAAMQANELSKPIRARGGWYLLGLQDRQEPLGTDVNVVVTPEPSGPPGTLPLARLLLPLPQGVPQAAIDSTVKAAMQVRQVAEDCDALAKLSQDPALKGSVYMNLGHFLLANLHPELQKTLAATNAGEPAMPVVLADSGVELFMRCDKRAPPPRAVFKVPTREEIQDRLFQEQIAALVRRYMRDLKRGASIEREGDNAVIDAALVK